MTGTTACFKDPRIDAAPVVTNAQTKLSRVIGDLCFDLLTVGMAKRIDDGLAPNAVALLENQRVQVANPALNYGLENRLTTLRRLFSDRTERLRQITQ